MARTLVATSSFTGSENPLSESLNWAQMRAISGGNVIKVSGQATGDHSEPYSAVRWSGAGAFTRAQGSELTLPAGFSGSTGDTVGVIVNATGTDSGPTNTYYIFYILENLFGGSSGASRVCKLSKVINNTETALTTSPGTLNITWSAGDKISLENDGAGNLTAYKNATSVGTATDTAITATGAPGFSITNSWVATPWTGSNVTGGGGGGSGFSLGDRTSGGMVDMSGGMYCKSDRVLVPRAPRIFIPGMTRRTPRQPTLSLR